MSSNSFDHVNEFKMLKPLLKRCSTLASMASKRLLPSGMLAMEITPSSGSPASRRFTLVVELVPIVPLFTPGRLKNGFGTTTFHASVSSGLPVASNCGPLYLSHRSLEGLSCWRLWPML